MYRTGTDTVPIPNKIELPTYIEYDSDWRTRELRQIRHMRYLGTAQLIPERHGQKAVHSASYTTYRYSSNFFDAYGTLPTYKSHQNNVGMEPPGTKLSSGNLGAESDSPLVVQVFLKSRVADPVNFRPDPHGKSEF